MPSVPARCSSQSGNVFYVILIGIVLFAALSAVIVQSGKGDTSALSNEKAEIYAAELMQYASSMAGAVRRMQMVNECADTSISFYKAGITNVGYQHSPDQPNKCQVFHPEGGSMTYQTPRTEWMQYTTHQDWRFDGRLCFKTIGVTESTCTAATAELSMILFGIKKEVCDQINKKAGLKLTTPVSQAFSFSMFNGSYAGSSILGGVSAETDNKRGYCLIDTDGTTANFYTFVYAILAR